MSFRSTVALCPMHPLCCCFLPQDDGHCIHHNLQIQEPKDFYLRDQTQCKAVDKDSNGQFWWQQICHIYWESCRALDADLGTTVTWKSALQTPESLLSHRREWRACGSACSKNKKNVFNWLPPNWREYYMCESFFGFSFLWFYMCEHAGVQKIPLCLFTCRRSAAEASINKSILLQPFINYWWRQ